jgi:hypothetical protein
MCSWQVTQGDNVLDNSSNSARVVVDRNFEFRVPLTWLLAAPVEIDKIHGPNGSDLLTVRVRLRFSLWQHRLPVDALPTEGWITLDLLAEEDLLAVSG